MSKVLLITGASSGIGVAADVGNYDELEQAIMKKWQSRCTTIAPGMVNTPLTQTPRNCVREVYLMPAY